VLQLLPMLDGSCPADESWLIPKSKMQLQKKAIGISVDGFSAPCGLNAPYHSSF
jgi:hypothetical protein